MKTSYLALIAFVLLSGTHGQLAAQPSKQEDIQKLLGIIGARSIGLRVFTQVIEGFKRAEQNQDVPAAVWQAIYSEAEARIDTFVRERLAPIYDQYLTHEDIKGLIAFYESPLGTKLLGVMPQMSQESVMAGRAWGQEFAEAVQKRLADQGSQ